MRVYFKKLEENAVVPKYAKPGDAGLDLVATSVSSWFDSRLNGYIEYGTGLAVAIPDGYVGLIFPRSSISNTELTLANSVGVIDSGYRGEIMCRFRFTTAEKVYKPGDRICQLVILPYPEVQVVETTDLEDTVRGTGGFGSSGN